MIAAAVDLLREGGSAALTARAVAERAGAAVGSVYGAFANLETLKLEANAVTMRALRHHLVDALRSGRSGSVTDRLLCLAEAYLGFARANREAWAAMFDRTTIAAPPAIAAEIAALFAVIESVLVDLDGLPPGRIPLVAKALWSSVHGMVYLGEVGGLGPVGQDDVPAMIETLVRASVRGLPGGTHS
ncbi:TetR/AcrR family transcriptional regulator [Enterovirga rhinocerotis]|uniref:TetR family transcriptional regulator n=1 Tax=Enterovirga rhinocerotis TaxID=1339210 RepID=A0A4R7BU08_9HYPH|nr:TetR/AcrR family transcriptional regulator [Enterovirga rhinocerotis]TDR89244.1 TetR family transcriptional regulator [Enterovirga rhinocerotis]